MACHSSPMEQRAARNRDFDELDAELGPECSSSLEEAPAILKHASSHMIDSRGLPERESPLCVRNTFLDYPLARCESLEQFWTERRVYSCPVSRQPSVEDSSDFESPCQRREGLVELLRTKLDFSPEIVRNTSMDVPATNDVSIAGFLQERSRVLKDDESNMSTAPPGTPGTPYECENHVDHDGYLVETDDHWCMSSWSVPMPLQQWAPSSFGVTLLPHCPPPSTSANILAVPSVGGDLNIGAGELPTMGSALHASGECRPCSFFHSNTRKCANGIECEFCHLCPPGEVKRRNKKRRAIARDVQNHQEGNELDGFTDEAWRQVHAMSLGCSAA